MFVFPGIDSWPGKHMHSHNYRVPEPFRDQVYVNFLPYIAFCRSIALSLVSSLYCILPCSNAEFSLGWLMEVASYL